MAKFIHTSYETSRTKPCKRKPFSESRTPKHTYTSLNISKSSLILDVPPLKDLSEFASCTFYIWRPKNVVSSGKMFNRSWDRPNLHIKNWRRADVASISIFLSRTLFMFPPLTLSTSESLESFLDTG